MWFFFVACKAKRIDKEVVTIDISNVAEGNLLEDIDKIFPNKQYIILGGDSIFISDIGKVMVVEDKIYVHDDNPHDDKLLVYGADGAYLYQIGEKGRAKGEYLRLTDYDVDSFGNVYILDSRSNKMLKYNNQGAFLREAVQPYSARGVNINHNGSFLLNIASWNADDKSKGKHLVKADSLGNIESSLSVYDKYMDENVELIGRYFSKDKHNIFFHQPICDTVFHMSANGELKNKYYFDFGKRRVPDKDKLDIENKLEKEYKNYTTLNSFCFIDDKFVYGGLFDASKDKFFILDRDNSILYKIDYEDYSPIGQPLSYNEGKLITYLDAISLHQNPDFYDAQVTAALEDDKTVLVLYSK